MTILLSGVAREILGSESLSIPDGETPQNVAALRKWLKHAYPEFEGLHKLAVSIDSRYADDEETLDPHHEIALVPPVSGG